jgi:2'-5' RNA ligase
MSGDYRIFVGAFPQGVLADRIQALRQQHDPKTARVTPPHVTLAGTYWRSGPATPENEAGAIAAVDAIAPRIDPFDLNLGGVLSFLPHNPVIYLGVEPTAGLLAARQALQEALGPDKHGGRFTPHLTLAMRLDALRTAALLAELQSSEWDRGRWTVHIDQLWLMQRGSQDLAWRVIHKMGLQKAP